MASKGEERLCRIESSEHRTQELRPGDTLRIGRHQDNDIVINDPTVSRFHARLTWDPQLGHPVVFDNGSQNWTTVDGDRVRTATPLTNGCRIQIGPHEFKVEVSGGESDAAILKDTGDLVALFSESGPERKGTVGDEELMPLLQELEGTRRSGTLHIESSEGQGSLTYCLGRIMDVEHVFDGTRLHGLPALDRILGAGGGSYRFTREMEPSEQSINMWFSDYVRSRTRSTEKTAEVKKPDWLKRGETPRGSSS